LSFIIIIIIIIIIIKGLRVKVIRCTGPRAMGEICWLYIRVCPDNIVFRFQFSVESPSLISVTHIWFWPNVLPYVTFSLLSVSAESEIFAFGRPLFMTFQYMQSTSIDELSGVHNLGHFQDNLPGQPLHRYKTPSLLNQSLGWYWQN